MIVRAIVNIDLKLDGTWKILQMFPCKPEDLFPDDEPEEEIEVHQVPKSASWHLENARKIRETRHHDWKVAHSHCTHCGECGKKRSTHRTRPDGSTYHTGEPFTGEKCNGEK